MKGHFFFGAGAWSRLNDKIQKKNLPKIPFFRQMILKMPQCNPFAGHFNSIWDLFIAKCINNIRILFKWFMKSGQ